MILNYLAEGSSDITTWAIIGIVVGALAAAAFGANQINEFLESRKDKPGTPANGELQLAQQNLSERVDVLDNKVASIEEDLKADREANQKHISMRSQTIFSKIDDVSKELRHEMQAQTDKREQQTNKLAERIEAMPEKLLNMLNTMGCLKK
jgi:hypothetical protein